MSWGYAGTKRLACLGNCDVSEVLTRESDIFSQVAAALIIINIVNRREKALTASYIRPTIKF